MQSERVLLPENQTDVNQCFHETILRLPPLLAKTVKSGFRLPLIATDHNKLQLVTEIENFHLCDCLRQLVQGVTNKFLCCFFIIAESHEPT